jgi:hypothetical protein
VDIENSTVWKQIVEKYSKLITAYAEPLKVANGILGLWS